ncbi:MAG: S8/S53 family peptidase [Bacteroidia bacterium]
MRIFVLTILIFFDLIAFGTETPYKKGEVLVMLEKDVKVEQVLQKNAFLNGKPTSLVAGRLISAYLRIWQLEFDSLTINDEDLLKQIRGSRGVAMAQFNHYTYSRVTTPNDAGFTQMWGLNNTGQSAGTPDADIDAPEAWDITTGGLTALGDTIVVAVIDGGFQLSHPDLNFWKNYHEVAGNGIDDDGNGYIDDVKGWNSINNSASIVNDTHGTHVAGTVGARGNNNMGSTGISWNVQVMAVCGAAPSTNNSVVEAAAIGGYDYVLQTRRLYNSSNGALGAFVVATNASFGIDQGQPSAYPIWCALYDSLGKEGILSAGATANQNWDIDAVGDIPTACPSNFLVSVTNTTRTDARNSGAAYGLTTIDLGAPGTSVYSTYPTNTWGSLTGTSMATPHVAGSIGLMYAAACPQLIQDYRLYPDSIALLMKSYLLNGVDVITSMTNKTVSNGRLNINNTLQLVQQYGNCAASATGINSLPSSLSQFQVRNVFPNPAENMVEIEYTSNVDNYNVLVLDVLGKIVKQQFRQNHAGINRHKLDTDDLPAGVYFIGLKAGDKSSNFLKLIKLN